MDGQIHLRSSEAASKPYGPESSYADIVGIFEHRGRVGIEFSLAAAHVEGGGRYDGCVYYTVYDEALPARIAKLEKDHTSADLSCGALKTAQRILDLLKIQNTTDDSKKYRAATREIANLTFCHYHF